MEEVVMTHSDVTVS